LEQEIKELKKRIEDKQSHKDEDRMKEFIKMLIKDIKDEKESRKRLEYEIRQFKMGTKIVIDDLDKRIQENKETTKENKN
jgi:soluble cytochrome b562